MLTVQPHPQSEERLSRQQAFAASLCNASCLQLAALLQNLDTTLHSRAVLPELCLKAVHLKQDHQGWSYSKVGKQIGCSHKFVSRWVARHQQAKGVSDQQRSGRPLKADADAQQYICMAAQLPECSSAADVAAKTQQEIGLKMSPSSITRLLRRQGLQHLTAKVVPMLTDSQKLDRVKFAKAALRRELCSWRRVMVTDSKYFRLHAMESDP